MWRQRKVYPRDFSQQLYRHLVEESGLEHMLAAQAAGASSKKRIHTNELKSLGSGKLFNKQGESVLDQKCSQWVCLAQKLENSAENRAKIHKLDKRLSAALL